MSQDVHRAWLRAAAENQLVSLAHVLQYIYRRVRRKRVLDAFMVFVGDEGAGKTELALQVGRRLDKGFGPTRIAYSHDQFMDIARRRHEIPRGSFILVDEGALVAFNLDFAKRDAKDLVKYIMAFRERGLIVALAIQRKRRLLPSVEERAHVLWITKEKGDDLSETRVYRNPGSNQFSSKGTQWLPWSRFDHPPITEDHPCYELMLACKPRKAAVVDRLGEQGAGVQGAEVPDERVRQLDRVIATVLAPDPA